MSGPKVVRVVTREELLARALDQIAQLEAAAERYATFGRRHDVNVSSEVAAHRKLAAELKALTQTNAWDVIARRSADGLRSLEHDRKVLEDTLIAAATKDRTVRRRLKEAALTIQREAKGLNIAVPAELDDVIKNVDRAAADDIRRMDATVAAASRALVQHTVQSKSVDAALTKRLSAGLSQSNFGEWLANNPIGAESQKSVRLDKVLAELQLRDFAITAPVAAAIQRIQAASDDERDVLIDSLTIELGGMLKIQQQRSEELARVEGHISRLEREGSSAAQNLIQAARATLASGTAVSMAEWEQRAENFSKDAQANSNLVNQRKALLAGLTAVGYEVREGMATALVENGRLVVKKPAEVEYGVEIVSGAADGRLQVRMVSFQTNSNPTRDKDIEVIWCGEFSQLQDKLARAGHSLKIEKALEPGAAPMKRAQLPAEQGIDASVDVNQPQARSL